MKRRRLRYVGLEAGMKGDEKWRLVGHGQHSLLGACAVDVAVLNDHVLLEYFHRVQLVGSLALRQRHLPTDRRHNQRSYLNHRSPGVCPWKWWTSEHLLWTNSCRRFAFFMCFWFQWLLSIVSDFYCVDALMVDRPFLLYCKALSLYRTVNEQKVKCWYFAWRLSLHLF